MIPPDALLPAFAVAAGTLLAFGVLLLIGQALDAPRRPKRPAQPHDGDPDNPNGSNWD